MNFRSQVAVVLLVMAVGLCPVAAFAVPAGQASQPSHPCCPPGNSPHSPAQQSDCTCVATLPSAPQLALSSASTPLVDVPTTEAAIQSGVNATDPLVFILPVSDQDTFLVVRQFRI